MTDHPSGPDDPIAGAEPPAAEPPAASVRPRRGWGRRVGRAVLRFLSILAILLAVAIITTVSVDLGPALRARAAKAGGNYLKREMTIGGLSVRLLTGTFIVDDLLHRRAAPRRSPVPHGEADRDLAAALGADSPRGAVRVGAHDRLDDGRRDVAERAAQLSEVHARRTERARSGSSPRCRSVRATEGEFIFEDHGTPWSTVARNLDVTVTRGPTYQGTARFSNGTVTIQNHLPMRTDMTSRFTIEAGHRAVQPAGAGGRRLPVAGDR